MKKIFLFIAIAFACIGKANAQANDMGDIITQMGENEINAIQENTGNIQNVSGAINDGIGHFNQVSSLWDDAHALYDATVTLDNNQCVPDLNVDASHMMPTACQGNGECQSCYTGAYRELAFIRRQLARLSCIYNNTKTFNQAALAFGDNASGIHAVTGLAWQNARGEIVAAYASFKHTYDTKYEGMIGSLQKALMDISRCEGQYGSPDWYQRFGFIYFEMMKEKYKRTD
ncbi:MAG: hypothetical protein ABJA78_17285 [Ferruginibacter sp.]